MTSPRGTLFLVDGSNNLYRSYYAIRNLSTSAGLSTNAAYGFTSMLRKLLKEQKPDAIAVAFDVGASTHRKEQFKDYKKDRRPMPDDLVVQIPMVHEICEGLGIPVIGIPDYEADDLIGSLACKARDAGYRVVIATSDKDFFQLVGNGILLYHTTRETLYDEAGVKEVFGLPPEQVLDVMAIWGDSIDNIPGVPGIGEKGAKSLIAEFGSLDALYEKLPTLKKAAQRKALETYKDQALLSRELARIKCDLDVDLDPEQLKMKEPDRARLHEIFSRLEFTSLMQEYMPEEPAVPRHYRLARDADEVRAYLDSVPELLAVHVESVEGTNSSPPAAASVSGKRNEALVIPLSPELGGTPELAAILRDRLARGGVLLAHDVKEQIRRLSPALMLEPGQLADTMLMSYVLNPGLPSHAIETVARDRLKREVISRKELTKASPQFGLDPPTVEYFAEKTDIALALHEVLGMEMTADAALQDIYQRIELPLVPVLARMEEKGIKIDLDLLERMSRTMGEQIDRLETQIYAAAGQEFNINSPSQLAVILFEKLQYPVLKKTQKTKSYSTSVEVLTELASHGYEVPKLILEHRELHKLKSTYIDSLPQLADSNGRVHTSFNQAVAATGRLSSSDPNLQNIPIRTAQGKEVRRAFIAEDGNVLIAADYSQIELRILAHICQDEELIDSFRRGADIHRATAAQIFNVSELLVNPQQRRAMKTINFGVLYGMSAFRLSNELGISTREAQQFIDAYFGRYPKIQEYLDKTLEEARTTGKVSTLFGRIRYIPEIHNRSWTVRGNAERMATNAPIQGTAADLLKLAMIALDRRLRDEAPDASMLLTVHDEIVIEAKEVNVEEVSAIVKETMETIHPLAVPLAVETCWGKSWFEAKE
ncbi:MAG: DNA polymerase I [Acidobacteriota bacterium]